jgi:hypothetical protein
LRHDLPGSQRHSKRHARRKAFWKKTWFAAQSLRAGATRGKRSKNGMHWNLLIVRYYGLFQVMWRMMHAFVQQKRNHRLSQNFYQNKEQ